MVSLLKTCSAIVWNGCMTSPAVWSPSADSCRLAVQLHWRLCRWSWCASDWREAYECQPSEVLLGERWWWGSSGQPGSWQHVQTTHGGQGSDVELNTLPHFFRTHPLSTVNTPTATKMLRALDCIDLVSSLLVWCWCAVQTLACRTLMRRRQTCYRNTAKYHQLKQVAAHVVRSFECKLAICLFVSVHCCSEMTK